MRLPGYRASSVGRAGWTHREGTFGCTPCTRRVPLELGSTRRLSSAAPERDGTDGDAVAAVGPAITGPATGALSRDSAIAVTTEAARTTAPSTYQRRRTREIGTDLR